MQGREMQIKTAVRSHMVPATMAVTKKADNDKVSEDVKKLEPSYTTVGNVKWAAPLEKTGSSLEGYHMIQKSTPRYIPKAPKLVRRCSLQHCPQEPNVETTQMSPTNEWKKRQYIAWFCLREMSRRGKPLVTT